MTDIPRSTSPADADDSNSDPPDTLERFRKLCLLLDPLGVATVTIEYNGAGDDGMIEEPVFEPCPERFPPV